MILKDPFSILKELGRFGSISEAAGPASPAICLFLLNFLIFHEIYMPGKKSRFLTKNDLTDFSRKYDFVPKDGANCDSGANSGQFGKPSYSIFHPTTLFWDAETIQEKKMGENGCTTREDLPHKKLFFLDKALCHP